MARGLRINTTCIKLLTPKQIGFPLKVPSESVWFIFELNNLFYIINVCLRNYNLKIQTSFIDFYSYFMTNSPVKLDRYGEIT